MLLLKCSKVKVKAELSKSVHRQPMLCLQASHPRAAQSYSLSLGVPCPAFPILQGFAAPEEVMVALFSTARVGFPRRELVQSLLNP